MLPAVPPWTQAVEVRWRPEPWFFRRRSEILNGLDEAGLVRAFIWQEREFGVQISDFASFQISHRGALLHLVSPTASREPLAEALDIGLRLLEPRAVGIRGIWLHHLLPLDSDARQAQVAAARQSAAESLGPEVQTLDYALLLDGRSDLLHTSFQVEWGIVGAVEVPDRLTRLASRVGFETTAELVAPLDPDLREVPPTAMLFDWYWSDGPALDEPADSATVVQFWEQVADESERLSNKVLLAHGFGDASDAGAGGVSEG